jgi:hypothetical protein
MMDREVGQFRHAPNIPQHPPRNSPQLVLNGNDGFDPSEEDRFAIVVSVVEVDRNNRSAIFLRIVVKGMVKNYLTQPFTPVNIYFMGYEPASLKEAILYFSDANNCLNYLAARRWPDGVVSCPACGRKNPHYNAERKVWVCSIKHEKRQFSVKLGTIFEDSPLGLDKWLPAVWLLANCKNGISSYEVAKDLSVTQKTAWFMLSRIRLGLQSKDGGLLDGEVETDESFIGGKARNMHSAKRKEKIQGRGPNGKAVVMGMLQRGGKLKTSVIANRDKETPPRARERQCRRWVERVHRRLYCL